MATVADAARPVGASPPPVRHGICRLTLRIGGTDYRLRPMPAPAGFRSVWVLRKLDPNGPAVSYSVAQAKGQPAACTCPDHELNGATCKHIMALAALGLIPRPKAARPRATSPARVRKLHAKNVRQAVGAQVARIGRGGYEICDGCGAEFDIQISGDPHFCETCVAQGGEA